MPNKSEPTHPLAEVFGFPIDDQSSDAKRYRTKRLCPFNNKVPNCTKDKAKNPLGVCSVYEGHEIAITCPIRFRQNWIIADDAADFFFRPDTKWTTLAEVRLADRDGKSAGNIDIVLVAYDEAGKVYDFGALEVQAVYISGNVRNPFEHYMQDTVKRASMDWQNEENYPRPDYLSSSRKRLAPQLIFKGGILNAWSKKTAVALNRGFFNTLPKLQEVSKADGEIAWLIYDVVPPQGRVGQMQLVRHKVVYSKWPDFAKAEAGLRVGSLESFIKHIETKLDESVV
jgi:hypothetical protein